MGLPGGATSGDGPAPVRPVCVVCGLWKEDPPTVPPQETPPQLVAPAPTVNPVSGTFSGTAEEFPHSRISQRIEFLIVSVTGALFSPPSLGRVL